MFLSKIFKHAQAKTMMALAGMTMVLGMASGITATLTNQVIPVETKAATSTTVYYAVSSATVRSYTVKCNVNRKGDGNDWQTYTMSKTSETFNGWLIYRATFTDLYDGLGNMQLQLYDGSTWKSQEEPIKSWTSASTYNGKMWIHGKSEWQTKMADTTGTLYYAISSTDRGSNTVRINVQGAYTAAWSMISMSDTGATYKGRNIFSCSFGYHSVDKLQFQLMNGGSVASTVEAITSYSVSSAYVDKMYVHGKNAWFNGSDSAFAEVVQSGDMIASRATFRVFFYNSGTEWSGLPACGIYAWGGSATKTILSKFTVDATIYNLTWFQDDNETYYGHADIPLDITGFKIVGLSAADNYDATVTRWSDTEFTVAAASCAILYGQYGNATITVGAAHDGVAGAALMSRVLQAIDTCYSGANNGYGGYSKLDANFFSHATAAAKNSSCVSLGGVSKTVAQHFAGLSKRASGGSSAHFVPGPTSDQSPLTTTLWVVLGCGLLGLGAIGTAYFVSKKKRHQA